MSDRDELAEIIGTSDGFNPDDFTEFDWDDYRVNADAILAAGYRKPRMVSTAEELYALPFESVVRDDEGFILERWGEPAENLWAAMLNSAYIPPADITLPATVLWEPQP